MARRVSRKAHARCRARENPAITSKGYLSLFVCFCYTQSGVYNLPRTTAQGIFDQCIPVSADELKPGDLVFFTGTYKSDTPVSHLGIYVGDGRMLQCCEPRISYADLSNSYWVRHLLGYGRLP